MYRNMMARSEASSFQPFKNAYRRRYEYYEYRGAGPAANLLANLGSVADASSEVTHFARVALLVQLKLCFWIICQLSLCPRLPVVAEESYMYSKLIDQL